MNKTKLPKKEFYMEGNNGGDYFSIKEVSEDTIYLEIGNCGVVNIRHIVPIEFLTSVLTWVGIETAKTTDKDICLELLKKYGWGDPSGKASSKFQEDLLAKIKKIN